MLSVLSDVFGVIGFCLSIYSLYLYRRDKMSAEVEKARERERFTFMRKSEDDVTYVVKIFELGWKVQKISDKGEQTLVYIATDLENSVAITDKSTVQDLTNLNYKLDKQI